MVQRIEISAKYEDTRASVLLEKLSSLPLSHPITQLRLIDVYTIDKSFSQKDLKKIGQMLANPVTQQFEIVTAKSASIPQQTTSRSRSASNEFSYAIETGFLPGVTDNVAHTTKEGIEDLLKVPFSTEEDVYSSQLLLLSGKLTKEDAQLIADSLINPLIQRVHVKSYKEYVADSGMDIIVPQVHLVANEHVSEVELAVSDEELITIGRQGIANSDGTRRGPLALELLYMKTIQAYFTKLGRKPTDIELESIAQTWSEHCKHTIFADPIDEVKNGLYKTYIKGATEKIRKKLGENDFCVSVFSDNSGAISFDDTYLITHKVETHNSPSALDPFGGAITGIVGVNRDTIGFGLGAKPVANFYGFCVADPADDEPLYKNEKLTQKMLSPRRILDGVVAGVNSGGNCSGIPTPQGFVYFDKRYKGKPLVFAGTVGLMPKEHRGKKLYEKQAQPGDLIVMIGGRVGKDGIHGATFSSVALDEGSPATAVQIGDPITQKKLSDAIVKEARDRGLFHSITDNGAGGLSCSVAEMAKESNGCIVYLERVPLKYPGLSPWEIWISESQERMTVAVPQKAWQDFSELMKRRGVEATVIGEFTDSARCEVTHNGNTIMDLDLEFLHNGLPKKIQQTKRVIAKTKDPVDLKEKELTSQILEFTRRLNLSSFEYISTQYDQEVQDNSVIKPLIGRGRVNGDASLIRPVLASNKGVVLTHAVFPSYTEIDPYLMSLYTIDAAIRQAVVLGADLSRLALLDNFCWCSSTEPERLWQLKEAVRGCFDAAMSYQTPFISGKDSMFNDFKGFTADGKPIKISIPPTLLISAIGVMPEVTKAVTLDFKFPGDSVYLLGETGGELGGSEYAMWLAEQQGEAFVGKSVPPVDMKTNSKVYRSYSACLQQGLIVSGISLGRGGLLFALSRASIAGQLGVSVALKELPGNMAKDTQALFAESAGRMLVSINPENEEKFLSNMKGIAVTKLGEVRPDERFEVMGLKGKSIVQTTVAELTNAYKERFKEY